MGSVISKSNKDNINKNWGKIKCTPLGPFLQMLGLAPGNANDTTAACKSAEFSAQFNSSMTEHVGNTNKLTEGLGAISSVQDNMRKSFATIQQSAFEDLSSVATIIFGLITKLYNFYHIITKNLINITSIFNSTVNLGSSLAVLIISFINLLRIPINGVLSFVDFFTRGKI